MSAPAEPQSAKKDMTDPALEEPSLLELAQSIGALERPSDAWIAKEEERVAWALCSAALRRGDEARLEQVLAEFGFGLPSATDSDSLLRQSAQMSQAPGYPTLSKAAWQRWMDARRRMKKPAGEAELSESEWLRVFLRSGFINTPSDVLKLSARQSPREARPGVSHEQKLAPALAAIEADNPVALAKALSVPGWREALASAEPEPVEGLASLDERQHRDLAESGRFAEGCLLSQTLWRGSSRCVILLLRLPEFSQTLLRDDLPRVDERLFEHEMSMARILKSLPKGFLQSPSAKPNPEADFEGLWRSHSFFESLLRAWALHKEKRDEPWVRAVETAMEMVEIERMRPQLGTGRGWAEMIARQCPSDDRSLAQARAWLERLRDRGAPIDWPRVSRLLAHKDSPAAGALGEWAMLEGERLPSAAAPRPRRI